MSRTFKVVLILLVVASIASTVFGVFAFLGKEREYMRRVMLEDKLAALLKDKRRLENEVDKAAKAKEDAEAKIKEAEASVAKLTAGIEEEKENSKSIIMDLADKKKELEGAKKALEQERKEKSNIAKQLADLEFENEKVKKEISRLKADKAALEQKFSDLKEKSVDLDKIVVGPQAAAAPQQAVKVVEKAQLKGTVLVVNKEYGFVVTDLGQDDGAQKGMKVELRDGKDFLGTAEIDKVYDTMSSASVLPGASVERIRKGNLVIESR